ncbi:hypothetical protein ALP94_00335 [Pseudomonas savastanoi pv. glycinea]|nr:hypothetical protein ALP94_00335 [Pseudomonas savastanoi pv. glycinea]
MQASVWLRQLQIRTTSVQLNGADSWQPSLRNAGLRSKRRITAGLSSATSRSASSKKNSTSSATFNSADSKTRSISSAMPNVALSSSSACASGFNNSISISETCRTSVTDGRCLSFYCQGSFMNISISIRRPGSALTGDKGAADLRGNRQVLA